MRPLSLGVVESLAVYVSQWQTFSYLQIGLASLRHLDGCIKTEYEIHLRHFGIATNILIIVFNDTFRTTLELLRVRDLAYSYR